MPRPGCTPFNVLPRQPVHVPARKRALGQSPTEIDAYLAAGRERALELGPELKRAALLRRRHDR
jgi:hypothetical protein